MSPLRDLILAEHSKQNCAHIVKWIGKSQSRFDELVKLFLHDEYMVAQRAAWPLSESVKDHPVFAQKHLGAFLKNLDKPGSHEAVKRNTIRLLEFITLPKKYQGPVMDLCFGYISSPTEKPAVKASALTVLQNLLVKYPEIGQELKTIIDDRWDLESPAFRARARKILRQLSSPVR